MERCVMETFNEIKKMIVNLFAVDEDTVVADAHLEDDLQGDSLAVMRLAEAQCRHRWRHCRQTLEKGCLRLSWLQVW